MSDPIAFAAMRSLLAARPSRPPRSGGAIATGVAGIDAALGGGLPRGRVTELISAAAGSGGELVFASLLAGTRQARMRVALVDAADGFAPKSFRPDLLRHLLWVRARSLAEAMACADVLVRDGNYGVLVLDVRGIPARALRQQPNGIWHRLRLAAEQHPAAVLVQSSAAVVRSAPWRLVLREPAALAALRRPRAERAAALAPELERGQGGGIEARMA